MDHLTNYELFESMDPVKRLTVISMSKISDPSVVLTLTVDQTNRISDVRNPYGVKHNFRMGNMLSKALLDKWATANGFKERGRQDIKKQLKGNELMKFMMKRGFRK